MGIALLAIGAIIAVICGIWFLVVAFKQSIGWGLACFFIPFVSLIFLIVHFDKAGKPFLGQLVGLGLIYASTTMGVNINNLM